MSIRRQIIATRNKVKQLEKEFDRGRENGLGLQELKELSFEIQILRQKLRDLEVQKHEQVR